MRGFWSTIVLIVILAGLVAYIRFDVSKQPSPLVSKEEKVLASVESDQLEGLRIRSESGETTTLEKADGGWQVVDPIATPADESKVTAITSGLPSISLVRVVDEKPTDLENYGLAKPRIDVGFRTSGDKDYRHLLIGEKSPVGGDVFAMRSDEKRVVLISANWEPSFNASTFDLREKALLKFDHSKLDGIEVSAGGKLLRFAKDGREWKLISPLHARADYGAVEGLVGRSESKAKSFVTDDASPADLKKYGLDKPEATLNLTVGSTKSTLLVGGKAGDGAVYVRDRSKPAVMTAESALADDLRKAAEEYRLKDIFEFHASNASRLDIARDGRTVVLERVKAEGDDTADKWRRVSPNAGDVDKDKMGGLLSRLESLRASSFTSSTAKTGLGSPAMTVVVKFDDGKKEERVTFGKAGTGTYAGRPDEPGAARIDTAAFDSAVKALDEASK